MDCEPVHMWPWGLLVEYLERGFSSVGDGQCKFTYETGGMRKRLVGT
jgi:hypothetical protein